MHDKFLSVLWVKFENGLRYFHCNTHILKAVCSEVKLMVSCLSTYRGQSETPARQSYVSWKRSGRGREGAGVVRKPVWSCFSLQTDWGVKTLCVIPCMLMRTHLDLKKKKATDFLILTSLFCLSSGIQMKTMGSPAAQHTNTYTPTWATS